MVVGKTCPAPLWVAHYIGAQLSAEIIERTETCLEKSGSYMGKRKPALRQPGNFMHKPRQGKLDYKYFLGGWAFSVTKCI